MTTDFNFFLDPEGRLTVREGENRLSVTREQAIELAPILKRFGLQGTLDETAREPLLCAQVYYLQTIDWETEVPWTFQHGPGAEMIIDELVNRGMTAQQVDEQLLIRMIRGKIDEALTKGFRAHLPVPSRPSPYEPVSREMARKLKRGDTLWFMPYEGGPEEVLFLELYQDTIVYDMSPRHEWAATVHNTFFNEQGVADDLCVKVTR